MSQTFRKLLENDNLLVGISELSRMCEISPRQLRYWEQKALSNPFLKKKMRHVNIDCPR